MSSRRSVFIALCVFALALVAAYGWYANQPRAVGTAAAPATGGGLAAAPVTVEVAAVERRAMAYDVSAVGSLVSNESVVLRPEIAGRIARIGFRDGEAVQGGAVLVELDSAVQRAELQQARARLTLASANSRRTEDLFARNFVSQSSRDNARAELDLARANLDLAQARLDRTVIRAPFAGVVGIRSVSPGDFVQDGDALINLEDIATLKLDFRLPELYLDRVQQGQVLELRTDVLPDEIFAARVDAIDPLVDAQGRALRLRASLVNPGWRLRPGVFVRVRLVLAERPDVLVVPEAALVAAPGNVQFVYQVLEGKAQRVDVSTGMRRDAVVEIVSGLAQ
ncbi:MAG: efflux RND transporter periplasmic adaptor subunit, partial [Thauera sp.]|nr:efflux RND transporter periplasmic adaptor subunit [Thauera sp.]